MNREIVGAIDRLARATLSQAATCADALSSLRELTRASAAQAETLGAYLEGQVAARARAFERPPGQWWGGCDDCGRLAACQDEDEALRRAVAHRWNNHPPVALGFSARVSPRQLAATPCNDEAAGHTAHH